MPLNSSSWCTPCEVPWYGKLEEWKAAQIIVVPPTVSRQRHEGLQVTTWLSSLVRHPCKEKHCVPLCLYLDCYRFSGPRY